MNMSEIDPVSAGILVCMVVIVWRMYADRRL